MIKMTGIGRGDLRGGVRFHVFVSVVIVGYLCMFFLHVVIFAVAAVCVSQT